MTMIISGIIIFALVSTIFVLVLQGTLSYTGKSGETKEDKEKWKILDDQMK